MEHVSRAGRALAALLALVLFAPGLAAQTQPIPIPNPGFEEGEPGQAPTGWGGNMSGPAPAYRAVLDPANPRAGRAAVRLESVADPAPGAPPFASLTSRIDATPYRSRRIRLTGAVRAGAPPAQMIGLWLRVDRAQGRRGFFDNMSDRPIRGAEWADYAIEGDVAADAERISFGMLLAGSGQAWLDEVRLEDIGPAAPPAPPARAASDYLDAAIALLRRHHINSAAADWDRLIADAREEIGGATGPAGTHGAIRGMLMSLSEAHSFLVPPQDAAPGGEAPAMPSYALLDGRFGMVRLPAFQGDAEQGAAYARSLRTGLTLLDRGGMCGWIVDLRGNGGGNMWPMLTGLDPLLGPAPFGSFRRPGGTETWWVRDRGEVRPGGRGAAGPPAFRLRNAARPVAVLLDGHTLSSGEITAIALLGRGGVRTFGAPSGGYTTANSSFPLADGARLVITTSYVRDRTGREYRGALTPDEPVAPAAATAAALRWLAGQPCPDAAD